MDKTGRVLGCLATTTQKKVKKTGVKIEAFNLPVQPFHPQIFSKSKEMTAFQTFLENMHIPSIEDVDEFMSGRKTIEEIQASWTVVLPEEMTETLHYTKGSKDALKSTCTPTQVLVARDCNENGAKAFKVVEWKKWCDQTAKKDNHEYECLRGTVYPYIDIESEAINVCHSTMLTHSIATFTNALTTAGLAIEKLAIANSSRKGKASYHVVIHTDKVFRDTTALKHFVFQKIRPTFADVPSETLEHIQWNRDDKVMDCVDWGVYTSDRVFRFLGQSKLGKYIRLKPFTDFDCEWPLTTKTADFLIGQYGQTAHHKLEHEVEVASLVCKDQTPTKGGASPATPDLTGFDKNYIGDLATLVSNTYIADQTNCSKFIWAMARSGASSELIHAHCKRTTNYGEKWVNDNIASAPRMNVNIGTLRYFAAQSDKAGYQALSRKHQKCEVAGEVHDFVTQIATEKYHEPYVRPFNFVEKDTILLKSHLGTGKTTQLIRAMKPAHALAAAPFKRILIISGRKSFTKFICGDLATAGLEFAAYDDKHTKPLALLPRLVVQVESLWRLADSFKKYDLVAIDESETVAHQFYSESTHRMHMIPNHVVFERCLSTATKVLFADAFLGQRSIQISEALRNVERTQIIENTYCPYARKAIQLVSLKNGKPKPALGEFCSRIMADLKTGRKVAVVWGSLNKAKAFAETFLKDTTYAWRLYSSESSPEHREELSDVATNWQSLDLLMYTSTITVGINYAPESEEHCFDSLYLYAAAAGGLPRDVAQALLRCRRIKSETLIYTTDTNALSSALYGRDTIRAAIADKGVHLRFANPVANWQNAPKWAEDVYIENENENGAKCIAYSEILQGYLVKSGYSLSNLTIDVDELELKCETVTFADIETLEADDAERIQRKSRRGMATVEEKMALQKWRFVRQFKLGQTDTFLGEQWAQFYGKNQEHLFWNQINEKHQTTEQYLAYESEQKYVCAASKKCLKRTVLEKMLPILGIKNTAETFSLQVTPTLVEAIKVIEQECYTAFQAHGGRHKGDFTASNAVDVVKLVFLGWNGIGVESDSKRKRSDGKQALVFTIKNKPNNLWETITDREKDEELE